MKRSRFKKLILLVFSLCLVGNANAKEVDIASKSYSPYLIGVNDQLSINVSGLDAYVTKTFVEPDGTLKVNGLPRLLVEGLSLQQLEDFLAEQYKSQIIDPIVNISLLQSRGVEILVKGMVEKEGFYTFPGSSSATSNKMSVNHKWPNLIDGLAQAGGVKSGGNIRSVSIIRRRGPNQSTQSLKATVNLYDLLESPDSKANISLRDGDIIIVPAAPFNEDSTYEVPNDLRAILGNSEISISVAGNVEKPGIINLPAKGYLAQALSTAGIRPKGSSKISFVRVSRAGLVYKKVIPVGMVFDSAAGSVNNPYLDDGDMVFVKESFLTSFSETVGSVSSPLLGLFGILSFF